MDASALDYTDVIYGLRSLGSSGIDHQDLRYRRLMAALNTLRSRRSENCFDYKTLSSNDKNPFNPQQYETLLHQIDAYTNFIAKGTPVPNDLLILCGVSVETGTDTSLGSKDEDYNNPDVFQSSVGSSPSRTHSTHSDLTSLKLSGNSSEYTTGDIGHRSDPIKQVDGDLSSHSVIPSLFASPTARTDFISTEFPSIASNNKVRIPIPSSDTISGSASEIRELVPSGDDSTGSQCVSGSLQSSDRRLFYDVICELLGISDALHRSNEFWGPSNFWLDYKDNLESNKLTYYLGILTNVKNMLQYVMRVNTNENIEKFYNLVRCVGLYEFVQGYQVGDDLQYVDLLEAVIILEDHVNLLSIQKNVKTILNLTSNVNNSANTHYNVIHNPLNWNLKRDVTEHSKHFGNIHRDHKKTFRKLVVAAAKSSEFVNKRVETAEVVQQKLRLDALRSNNEEEYIKLLNETKQSKFLQIIKQTEQYMNHMSNLILKRSAGEDVLIDDTTTLTTSKTLNEAKQRYYALTSLVKEDVDQNLPSIPTGKLRKYQVAGLKWLVSLYNNKLNGILADEMGLGKTIQTIVFLAYLKDVKGISGVHIVVAPLSTLHGNWLCEFNKWYPSCRICLYEGSKEWRKGLIAKWYDGTSNRPTFDVLLTTDSFILRDKCYLRKINWEYLIIDEAHRLKNPNSKLVKVLNQGFVVNRRLALTGTPLQNDLHELWGILNFLMPELFSSSKSFDKWYAQDTIIHPRIRFNVPLGNIIRTHDDNQQVGLTEEEQLLIIDRIHKILRPFILRREKHEVADEVPANMQYVICCPMSGIQTRLYEFLNSKDNTHNKMIQLRRVCNHPYLYSNGNYPCDDTLITTCGKFAMLDVILSRLYVVGHRVLIFSQMTSLLDILESYLNLRNYKYLRLDGSTTSEKRIERLNLFNAEDSEYFCFILSTKAGALGLNLQTADTVIIYDSDWNPQNDVQAESRVHRIGQKRQVLSLRFVTPNTVEENILKSTGIKLSQDALAIKTGEYYGVCNDRENTKNEQVKEILRRNNCYDENYGIRVMAHLNEILIRSDNDRNTFYFVAFKNFLTNPFGLIRERILPPFLLKAIIESKKYNLTDEDKRVLSIEDVVWRNICYDYDMWNSTPTDQCLDRLEMSLDGDDGRGRHVITGLSLDYPQERVPAIEYFIRSLCEPADESNRESRIKCINSTIKEILTEVIDSGKYPEFVVLPDCVYLSDYYDRIKFPICLNDLVVLTETNSIDSLLKFKLGLERLCNNARCYNGSESIIYHRALQCSGDIIKLIINKLPIEFIKIYDPQKALELELVLTKHTLPESWNAK